MTRDATLCGRAPAIETMPWLRNNPPGFSARNTAAKYVGSLRKPTCSTIPMLAALSNRASAPSVR
jgi:hypothetical protein